MNNLNAPSLQSLLDSDRGSNDSLLAESLQLDIEELDDAEYSIPVVETLPTLESVLNELDSEFDNISESSGIINYNPTPTPSTDMDSLRLNSILRHIILQGVTAQICSAADRVGAGLATSLAVNQKIAVGTSHGHILAFDITQALRWCCQEFSAQGAVSALAFNDDSTRLLAGFSRGYIIMIDTAKGDVIRSLSDVITPNTGVLHLKWTDRPALALCSDSGGSVWCLNFTRRLGIRGCSSRCLFSGARGEVCAIEPLMLGEENHPLKPYSIIALATLSKFFVVMIRPRLKVIKFQIMAGPPDCLPLLAWQLVLIQAADSTRTVDPVLAAGRGNQLYFHQLCYNSGRLNLLFLRRVTLSYNLLALHWLGPKSLATLDTSEILHLSEVRTNKEMENIDMCDASLVYGSAQFKGLATGGNVSPALALAGINSCYNSVISRGTQLYILGARSLHAVSVRPWSDRISHFATQHRWSEAIDLAIDVYRSANDRPKRQIAAKERILRLIDEYLVATQRCPEMCLSSVMKCLIEINEMEILWQDIWDRLTSPYLFLNCLTEHIENGDLTEISPIVSQSLCEYLEKFSPKKLEEIILKIDWICLDLHQVLSIVKREKLYKAQMHLNTKALGDYTISLTELIPLITEEKNAFLGNCMLVYISSCLAGRGYPFGDINPDIIPTVKHEVLRCLTAIHSNSASDDELPYPYFRILLKFDTRETLNVLSLAFEEKEFSGELGQSHRQRIVNILLEIMTPEQATWAEIGCLLNFISQQISTKNLPDDEILLKKIVGYLSMEYIDGETSRQHTEREQAWLELLTSNILTYITTNELLQMARKSKCFRVVEYLLDKCKKYDNIFDCYILDKQRHIELFGYIRKYIGDDKNRKIYEQILKYFPEIFTINSEEIVKILVDNYNNKIKEEFLTIFDNNPRNKFIFLGHLFKLNVTLESDYCENYILLLCKFNPENVETFLRTNDCYNLEIALNIVKEYQLHSASVYLYERMGDYQSAFNLSIDILKEAPESLAENCALDVANLCSRASDFLTDNDKELLWFSLLEIILSRNDLVLITRNILHTASRHVDLHNLVQLVLSTNSSSTQIDGNFGDIKHLIVGMLSNSRYETLLLQTTSRILGNDLHQKFAKEKLRSNQGLCIKSIKCIICRCGLFNKDNNNIIVFGNCGHAIHKTCFIETNNVDGDDDDDETFTKTCPRCGLIIKEKESLCLAEPKNNHNNFTNNNDEYKEINETTLNLEAPIRIGIVRQ